MTAKKLQTLGDRSHIMTTSTGQRFLTTLCPLTSHNDATDCSFALHTRKASLAGYFRRSPNLQGAIIMLVAKQSTMLDTPASARIYRVGSKRTRDRELHLAGGACQKARDGSRIEVRKVRSCHQDVRTLFWSRDAEHLLPMAAVQVWARIIQEHMIITDESENGHESVRLQGTSSLPSKLRFKCTRNARLAQAGINHRSREDFGQL
jgi:hypothetical protein